MRNNDWLRMWTVYDHPSDYPDYFVARLSEIDGAGARPTQIAMFASELPGLRARLLAMGLTRLVRQPGDDPVIVEVWL